MLGLDLMNTNVNKLGFAISISNVVSYRRRDSGSSAQQYNLLLSVADSWDEMEILSLLPLLLLLLFFPLILSLRLNTCLLPFPFHG